MSEPVRLLNEADPVDAKLVDAGLRIGNEVAISDLHIRLPHISFLQQIVSEVVGGYTVQRRARVLVGDPEKECRVAGITVRTHKASRLEPESGARCKATQLKAGKAALRVAVAEYDQMITPTLSAYAGPDQVKGPHQACSPGARLGFDPKTPACDLNPERPVDTLVDSDAGRNHNLKGVRLGRGLPTSVLPRVTGAPFNSRVIPIASVSLPGPSITARLARGRTALASSAGRTPAPGPGRDAHRAAGRLGHKIEAFVHAVDRINVGVTGRPKRTPISISSSCPLDACAPRSCRQSPGLYDAARRARRRPRRFRAGRGRRQSHLGNKSNPENKRGVEQLFEGERILPTHGNHGMPCGTLRGQHAPIMRLFTGIEIPENAESSSKCSSNTFVRPRT